MIESSYYLPIGVALGSAVVMWQAPRAGTLLSLIGLYLIYQISSLLYVIPYYKDGGNGSLADWSLWLLKACVLTAIIATVILSLRALSRAFFARTRS